MTNTHGTGDPPARGSALRRVLGNSLWLVAAEAGTRAVSFVTILYLSRTLAREGMGIVEFGVAVFGLVQVVSTGGVDVLLTRAAAERPGDAGRLAGRSLALAWSHFLVAFGVLVAGVLFLPRPAEMRWGAVLFGLAAAAVPLGMRFAFVAGERAWVVGLGALLGYAAFLGLCVLGVRAPEHLLRVPLFWIVAVSLRSTVQLVAFVRAHGPVAFDGRGLGSWLQRTLALDAGSIARGLMTSVDVLVLGVLAAPAEVARYGIAAKLPLFLTSLATLVYTALFPTLARAVLAGDARRVAAIQRDTLAAVLGVAVPGALCLALVAEPLVLLLFTEKFQASVPVFAVLVWRFPLAAATGLFRTALWARSPGGDARTALQVLAVTVVVVVVFAGHAGAIGAAYGMLLGDALALALYAGRAAAPAALAFVRRDWLARLGLAAGVAGGLVLVLPRDAGVATIAGALAAWAAASLVVDLPLLRRLWHEMRGAADGTRPAE